MNPVNNTVNNTFSDIGKGFQKSFEVSAYTVNQSEALEKFAKITERVIRVVAIVYGNLSEAVSNFATQLKDTIIVFEAVRFIGVMNLLISPKNGKYFLADPANSWQKCADKVTLAFHCAFKTVKGLNKFGFVDLGRMAKNAIGQLPFFVLVMDSFILASSIFSTWDSVGNALPKFRLNLLNAENKIDKWKDNRPMSIELLKTGDEIECKYFESLYRSKAFDLQDQLESLEKKVRLNEDKRLRALESEYLSVDTPVLPKKLQEKVIAECQVESLKLGLEIGRVQVKLQKTDERIKKIAARDCKGLAQDLEKADFNFKIRKWEVCKYNAAQDHTKVWFRIISAIGKIAVVTLALSLTALNVWAAPFILSLLLLGIAVDSIGLTKIYLDEFLKHKPLPKKPVVLVA